jgi:N-methylhydantoinase A
VIFLAVDIGGTFTDLMAYDGEANALYQAKSLTTYHDLSQGVLDCVSKSKIGLAKIDRLIHGSTIAINTLIERKGARTALLVTKGTRDVYAIGRGNRPDAYNLNYQRPRPLVPRRAVYEVDQRATADGEVIRELDANEVGEIARRIRQDGFEAVAVCFLHSYANPEPERAAGRVLGKALNGAYVSLSHEIMREYREYERISTTVVNAYIGPKVSGYVSNLDSSLRRQGFAGKLAIMQSNGGVMSPEVAARRPVTMMESGPVGGIIAGAEIARKLGFADIISFDMGGTTAKASLVRDGQPTMADGYYVGGYESGDPVKIPVVDVVEVGTGGGSIAWLDEVGALKVGPRSAGSEPGPIAYARGGQEPTITDANVVLGRIGADDFLGGEMKLDAAAARAGLDQRIGKPLKLSAADAAIAIIDIAVAKMSLAVRQVSVQQGHDPRDFTLVASGGAGPVHAVAIARDLKIPRVIIPNYPSHFSALGMLMADERHDLVRTYWAVLDKIDFAALETIYRELEKEGRALCQTANPTMELFLDIRYLGQEFSLPVPVSLDQIRRRDAAGIRAAFDALHQKRYAHHAENEPVEMINLRLVVRAGGAKPRMVASAAAKAKPAHRDVHFDRSGPISAAVYDREALAPGMTVDGPALIREYGSTTVFFAGDRCTVASTGELIIEVGGR